ncbi:hypothetical protein [Methylobacterium sp. WL6]|uniref:hypothetical protein n=1 Tax=Methylobacterium sp. WL6 TaxID=2603901 RepID=UPI0011CAE165|nr:hypothetical protein [Methylobacterium sp. WL6]TXN70312.1 hypothetical protein FV230_10720 [Methylobacterium sp. WL6]
MARPGKYVALIWDNSLSKDSNLSQEIESIGLTLHEVESIDAVLDIKFNNTLLFFYVVDKFNGKFNNLSELKRKYRSKKFICIDMLGFESLKELCDENNIIYIRRKFDADRFETFVTGQCIDVLRSFSNPGHVEQSETYQSSKLSERIDTAAYALRDLRLNSTGEIVEELLSISRALKENRLKSSSDTSRRDVSVKGETKNALQTIGGIFDAIENSGLAAIVVSGAVTAVIGCGGWSAVACQTVCLASWHGKEALIAAIDKLPGPKIRQKRQKSAEIA